jgi:cell wall-associated NlpC family hydrolase
VEGLTAVQSRIAEIQSRMATFAGGGPNAAWLSAASAAGLMGSSATAATTGTTATAAAAGTTAETAVVQAATNYLGVPYLWGGTDPAKGLDCSGFTQRVFADVGITIPVRPASRPPRAPPSRTSPTPAPVTSSSSTTARPAPASTTSGSTSGTGR